MSDPDAQASARPAIFLDRDGTIIEHVHYISDPAKVRLLPGAAGALRRFRDAGYALVVVTNQSAIGRGAITLEQYRAVDAEMRRQLAAEGIEPGGVYFCPEVPPDGDDRTLISHGDRKPGPGMLLRASADLGLDPMASWMIGDMISDALAGINARCRGSVLVRTGHGLGAGEAEAWADSGHPVADDLAAAADLILASPDGPGR